MTTGICDRPKSVSNRIQFAIWFPLTGGRWVRRNPLLTMKPNACILATCLITAVSSVVLAANSSLIQSPLTNTGVDAEASGRVLATLTRKQSELIVQVAKLAPAAAYGIEVGGIVEANFTTNAAGAATVKFKAPKAGKKAVLDFDPRGKLLRVLAAGQSVLETTLSAEGEAPGAVVVERVNLALGAATGATGKAAAEYRLDKKGRRIFKVEVERAGTGLFELFVGGVKRGDFTTFGTRSKIKFAAGSDDVGVLPLDFDPRGQVIDVVRAGQVVFSSEFAAQALGVNVASPRLSQVEIPSTGADADGHAEAKLRIDDRARKHFSVEIEDVPVGTYDLLVDSVDVADIVVTATASGTKGEVEFTSGDDDPEELPLAFDPAGKTLTVRQGATVFFEGVFTPTTGDGSGTPVPEPPSEFEESLATTGLDPDATAKARYRVDDKGRHKFNVEIEKVAAGDYKLVVAGTIRGTIHAVTTASGIKGEIEFDSKVELGHRPLNFDPRGQLIEITSTEGAFFSHILGSGSATSGGGTTVPFETSVPLLSTGADANATAKATLKLKATGELSFEVEVEDVNVGAYEVVVGGTVRGTLNVTVSGNGTRGKIEFDTEAGAGKLPLNFTIAGEDIIVRQGVTVFFERIFPTL